MGDRLIIIVTIAALRLINLWLELISCMSRFSILKLLQHLTIAYFYKFDCDKVWLSDGTWFVMGLCWCVVFVNKRARRYGTQAQCEFWLLWTMIDTCYHIKQRCWCQVVISKQQCLVSSSCKHGIITNRYNEQLTSRETLWIRRKLMVVFGRHRAPFLCRWLDRSCRICGFTSARLPSYLVFSLPVCACGSK